jgi:type I restriction enzyme S subunit
LDDLDTMAFSDADREKYSLRAGDLLVCEGGEVGRSAVWRGHVEGVYFQKAIHRLRPRRPDVLTDYVVRVMRQAAQSGAFTELTSQTSIAHLTQEKLGLFAFLLPPLPEQRAIAAVLDTIDDAIQKTEQIIAKLQQVKQGLLHDLLTRGIDDNGELRDPERHPEQFQDSPLGRIPKGWEVVTLGGVLDEIEAGKSPSCPDLPADGDDWGVLKVSAVHPDGFRGSENKRVTVKQHINPVFEVRAGDLLMTRANTPELVGLTCLVEAPRPRLMLCDKTLRLVVSTAADRAFIFFASQMPFVRSQIESKATGSSGSMKNIGQQAIRNLRFPLAPLSEQKAISTRLLLAIGAQQAELKTLGTLRGVKSGLSDDLLTGRVRTTSLPGFSA